MFSELSDGLFGGDLTSGASLAWGSTGIPGPVLTDTGLTCGFSAAVGFFSMPFPGSISSFLSFTITFVSVFNLRSLPVSLFKW